MTATIPPIAVIAGGLGTRLYPVTRTVPKSLVPVNRVPFIDHQLKLFADRGLTRVVYCIGHLGHLVETHLAERGTAGLEVLFSHDGNVLRGTGGALRKALPLLGEEFLVTYGDSYLDVDYGSLVAAFRRSGAAAMMSVFRNADCWDRSNVEYDGAAILAYDKENRTPRMAYIDYGLLAMRANCFKGWEDRQSFDLAELLKGLVAEKRLAGFEMFQRFYEVGSESGIADLSLYLARS